MDGDRAKIWLGDFDGDGHDEVVCLDGGKVRSMRPGDEKWLWQWPSSGNVTARHPVEIREILPAGKTFPATVAIITAPVAAGPSVVDGVAGLAGPTGKMRWRFDTAEPSDVLAGGDPTGLPRIFTTGPGAQRNCGIALPTDEEGKYLPLTPQPVKYDEAVEIPRLTRPLPWVRQGRGASIEMGIVAALICAVAIGLTIGKRSGKLLRRLRHRLVVGSLAPRGSRVAEGRLRATWQPGSIMPGPAGIVY